MQKFARFFLLLLSLVLLVSFITVKNEKIKIKWITLTELKSAYAKKHKPILIDVYTSWCGWCKVMDRETYTNEKVAGYINENFYAVKFDAETTDSVSFGTKKYGYNAASRVNELANFLLFGRLGYPTTVFLSTIDAQPAPISGYLKPAEIEPPLKYFGGGAYKKQDYNDFMKVFAASW